MRLDLKIERNEKIKKEEKIKLIRRLVLINLIFDIIKMSIK